MRPDVAVSRLFTDAHESLPASPDLIGFSFSWELDYTNIMTTLADLGVPMLAEGRGDEDPLVRGPGRLGLGRARVSTRLGGSVLWLSRRVASVPFGCAGVWVCGCSRPRSVILYHSPPPARPPTPYRTAGVWRRPGADRQPRALRRLLRRRAAGGRGGPSVQLHAAGAGHPRRRRRQPAREAAGPGVRAGRVRAGPVPPQLRWPRRGAAGRGGGPRGRPGGGAEADVPRRHAGQQHGRLAAHGVGEHLHGGGGAVLPRDVPLLPGLVPHAALPAGAAGRGAHPGDPARP